MLRPSPGSDQSALRALSLAPELRCQALLTELAVSDHYQHSQQRPVPPSVTYQGSKCDDHHHKVIDHKFIFNLDFVTFSRIKPMVQSVWWHEQYANTGLICLRFLVKNSFYAILGEVPARQTLSYFKSWKLGNGHSWKKPISDFIVESKLILNDNLR